MIPNIFHFVFLAPDEAAKPFDIVHYLAVKSASCVNKPDQILLHYNVEPSGEWWEKARPYLTLNKIVAPSEIFGRRLCHAAHKADVVRLQMLRDAGGVYLDIDTICIKPLHEFYRHRFAIGQQLEAPDYGGFWQKLRKCLDSRSLVPLKPSHIHGLCNAVMLSEKKSPFVTLWLDAYRTFRSQGEDEFWDEHSIKVPFELSRQYPQLLTKLSPYFFNYPLWDPEGLAQLFDSNLTFNNAYIHHVWENKSRHSYLSNLTAETIMQHDSTYNSIARNYL